MRVDYGTLLFIEVGDSDNALMTSRAGQHCTMRGDRERTESLGIGDGVDALDQLKV